MTLLEQLSWLTTEAINPRTADVDLLSAKELVAVLHQEDLLVANAVGFVTDRIVAAVDMLVGTIQSGKRMVYVGAGTSGRLGILDASEMPPTFGVDPDLISGVIAGGKEAVFRSFEGAEDNRMEGGLALRAEQTRDERNIGMVIGLSASGRTPFVLGALDEAKERHMHTVLVSTNSEETVRTIAPNVDLLICAPVGPEPIAGSTRMKSGTAQKMIINMITTAAMIRLGKTYGNVMVDVKPTNEKLRARAIRIVQSLADVSETPAREALTKAQWNVKAAIVMLRMHCSLEHALERLEQCGGLLRLAISSGQ